MKPAEFADLTPRELVLILDEYNGKIVRDRESSLESAYMAAYLQRVKRMPTFEQLLDDSRPKTPKQPQSDEQMLAAVKRMQARISREEG